jgi:hypothetical protein
VRYSGLDNVGNAEAPKTLQIDTVAPTSSLTLSNVTGRAYLATGGTTVWYRGTAAGSFRITNAVTDAASGAGSSATAALTGTTTGWTHAFSTVSTPAGGPFVSNAFSWTAGTTSSPSEVVTTADAAGNTTATALTFATDSTAPTGALTFPAGGPFASGAAWRAGCATPAVAEICGTVADAGAGVTSVVVDLNRSNGDCWDPNALAWGGNNCGSGGFAIPFTAGSTSWTYALPCTVGTFTISVVITDGLGNTITLGPTTWTQSSCA